MKRISRMLASKELTWLAPALWMSIFLIAPSQAQTELPIFQGRFELSNQVLWGKTVLQPGDYTITIRSSSMPIRASVIDSKGHGVGQFVSFISEGGTRGTGDALLLQEQRGQLCVYSLVLGHPRMSLTYDPALAREAALEARATQSVPVILAKR